jgi:hypothetical protein
MRRANFACLVLGTLVVVATPVFVYWCVGDLSSVPASNADYDVRPPHWSAASVTTAGLGALFVLLASTLLLLFAVRRRSMRPEWLGVVGPLAGIGATIAVGYRIATTGVIGANIGYGFFLMFGVPVCIGLAVWAVVGTKKLTRKHRSVLIVRSGDWLYDGAVQMPVDVVALDFDGCFELRRADDGCHAGDEPQPLGPDGFLYFVRFQGAGRTTTPTWVDSGGHPTVEGAMATAQAKLPWPISWHA